MILFVLIFPCRGCECFYLSVHISMWQVGYYLYPFDPTLPLPQPSSSLPPITAQYFLFLLNPLFVTLYTVYIQWFIAHRDGNWSEMGTWHQGHGPVMHMVTSLTDIHQEQVASIRRDQDNSFLPLLLATAGFPQSECFWYPPPDTDGSRSGSNEIIRPGNLLKIITQIISNFFSPGRMVKVLVDNISTLINPCRVPPNCRVCRVSV